MSQQEYLPDRSTHAQQANGFLLHGRSSQRAVVYFLAVGFSTVHYRVTEVQAPEVSKPSRIFTNFLIKHSAQLRMPAKALFEWQVIPRNHVAPREASQISNPITITQTKQEIVNPTTSILVGRVNSQSELGNNLRLPAARGLRNAASRL